MKVLRALGVVMLGASLLAGAAAAQEEEPAPQLRVQVVFRETEGEKVISRLPYTLHLRAEGPNQMARLRSGLRIPIVRMGQESRIQYHQVGTEIDFWAEPVGDGRFRARLVWERSSMLAPDASARRVASGAPAEGAGDAAPILGSFSGQQSLFLRDGQTLVVISSSDPVTGRVLHVDVTLTVVRDGGKN
jgi:hypothetical protein